jgi:hypothetical protein
LKEGLDLTQLLLPQKGGGLHLLQQLLHLSRSYRKQQFIQKAVHAVDKTAAVDTESIR